MDKGDSVKQVEQTAQNLLNSVRNSKPSLFQKKRNEAIRQDLKRQRRRMKRQQKDEEWLDGLVDSHRDFLSKENKRREKDLKDYRRREKRISKLFDQAMNNTLDILEYDEERRKKRNQKHAEKANDVLDSLTSVQDALLDSIQQHGENMKDIIKNGAKKTKERTYDALSNQQVNNVNITPKTEETTVMTNINKKNQFFTVDDLVFDKEDKFRDRKKAEIKFENGLTLAVIQEKDGSYRTAVTRNGALLVRTDVMYGPSQVSTIDDLNKIMKNVQRMDAKGKLPEGPLYDARSEMQKYLDGDLKHIPVRSADLQKWHEAEMMYNMFFSDRDFQKIETTHEEKHNTNEEPKFLTSKDLVFDKKSTDPLSSSTTLYRANITFDNGWTLAVVEIDPEWDEDDMRLDRHKYRAAILDKNGNIVMDTDAQYGVISANFNDLDEIMETVQRLDSNGKLPEGRLYAPSKFDPEHADEIKMRIGNRGDYEEYFTVEWKKADPKETSHYKILSLLKQTYKTEKEEKKQQILEKISTNSEKKEAKILQGFADTVCGPNHCSTIELNQMVENCAATSQKYPNLREDVIHLLKNIAFHPNANKETIDNIYTVFEHMKNNKNNPLNQDQANLIDFFKMRIDKHVLKKGGYGDDVSPYHTHSDGLSK